jgi:hypothetical protein
MYEAERWAGNCKTSCATCLPDNSGCSTCLGDRVLVGLECLCPHGTIDDYKSTNCPSANENMGLVAYYPFHNHAMDVIGGYHGTIHNVTPAANRFGIPNTAYEFKDDWVNWNYITLPRELLNGKKSIAISIWVKWSGD